MVTAPRGRGCDRGIRRTLLRRYGVIFRKIAVHEGMSPPWRDLVRVCRRLGARGDIRGGRFVEGVWGEQFALPEVIPILRSVRKNADEEQFASICAADPLNLTGVITPGKRVPSLFSNRVLYRDGVPVAVKEGKETRLLEGNTGLDRWEMENKLKRWNISPKLKPYLNRGSASSGGDWRPRAECSGCYYGDDCRRDAGCHGRRVGACSLSLARRSQSNRYREFESQYGQDSTGEHVVRFAWMGIGQRSGQCIGSVDFTIIHSTWDDCGGTSHGGRYSEYGYVTSSDLVFSSRFSGFSSVSLVWCSVGETKAGLIWITTGSICSVDRDERFPYVSVVNS